MPKMTRFYEVGGPEVLRYEDVEVGEPGAGQVRLQHGAVALNFADTYFRSGLYPAQLPSGIGSDACGTITAVGPDVTDFKVGDRVTYTGAHNTLGAYSTERLIDAYTLIRLPDAIGFETAAAITMRGLTAAYLMRRLYDFKGGETVLLHAAAGGVGLLVSQWAQLQGLNVIGTVSSEAKAEVALITKLLPHLNEGNPALTLEPQLDDDERKLLHSFQLLSDKKSIFACNVNEDELADAISNPDAHPYVSQVKKYVAEHHNAEAIVISARIEEELIDVSEEESREFLESLGVRDSGVSDLIRAVYHLLGLRTYLTTGIKETRAWTIPSGAKAPQAAGVIHTDFERGFIAAEVVHYDDLVSCGGKAGAREHGKLRIEGKEYVVKDGDVIEFRFNV